jgi:hypothetical protein
VADDERPPKHLNVVQDEGEDEAEAEAEADNPAPTEGTPSPAQRPSLERTAKEKSFQGIVCGNPFVSGSDDRSVVTDEQTHAVEGNQTEPSGARKGASSSVVGGGSLISFGTIEWNPLKDNDDTATQHET